MVEHNESSVAWDDDHSAYAQYLLRSKQEIVQVLRGVMKGTELVTAYFDHGKQFFLTSVVGVQPENDALVLDYGVDREINQRALQATRMVFVTSQERVKVQFSTGPLQVVQINGLPAFRTNLPTTLLKLQRREFYRLVTPMRAPLTCVIPAGEGRVEAAVTDISIGGVGLSGLLPDMALEEGTVYQGCRIALPEEGTILAALEVRSVQDITLRSGAVVKRAGMSFVNLPASQQALIQRYINRVDRERVALLKGS